MISQGITQSQNPQSQAIGCHVRRGSQSPKNRVNQIVEVNPRISTIQSRLEAVNINKNEITAPSEPKLERVEPVKEFSPATDTNII